MISQNPRRPFAEWKTFIEEQQKGPLSVAAFCRKKDLSAASFYGHLRRWKEEKKSQGFVELQPPRAPLLLRREEGVWVIALQAGFDPVCLQQVLMVLDA